MQNRNLPAEYKPRGWNPFKLHPDVKRILLAIGELFRLLLVVSPKTVIFGALGSILVATVVGTMMGAVSPGVSRTVVVYRAGISPVDSFVQETITTDCFPGNKSTFEGEEVGVVSSDFPPKEEPELKLVDPVENKRPKPATGKPDPDAFIKKWAPTAIKYGKKYGVPPSIILVQALLESNSGVSTLAVNNRNFFGHKCFDKKCGKGHCSNYTDDTHKDFFRKYPSAVYGFEEHAKKISSGRYKKLKKYGNDIQKWAYGLKSVGYATDRKYAEKLIGAIRRSNLTRFDR